MSHILRYIMRVLHNSSDSLLCFELRNCQTDSLYGGANEMKRELGLARCGLACCLCSENETCAGCHSDACRGREFCENRKCSVEKEVKYCYECKEECRKGLLQNLKPYVFTLFARQYGVEYLLDCLERNEANGVVYHREGVKGDYDNFETAEALMKFIKTGNSQGSCDKLYCRPRAGCSERRERSSDIRLN